MGAVIVEQVLVGPGGPRSGTAPGASTTTGGARAYFGAMARRIEHSRAGLAALTTVLIVMSGSVIVGCRGSDSSSSTSTTSATDGGVTADTAPGVRVFSDPSQPISVDVAEQFAIVLDAEPASGDSWLAVERPDPAIVLTIGTEFRAPAETVTTDISTPDTTDTTADPAAAPTSPGDPTTAAPTTVVDATASDPATSDPAADPVDPATSAPPDPIESQVLRYGARATGTTQIKLRYGPPGSASPDDPIVVFTVIVFDSRIPTTTAAPIDTTPTTAAPITSPPKTIPTKPKSTTTTKPRSTTTTAARTTTTT